MDRPLVAVVLAGGTGTRLYPASRGDRPKQFLALAGGESMLAETVERAGFADEVYVLTREAFRGDVREHAPGAAVLTEPEPRDTGPALVYAAHRIDEQVDDAVVLALPSDHHVRGDFESTARAAAGAAVETGGLVTIGVEPTRAAGGYGYVEPGGDRDGYYAVESFTEKPDPETARRYVREGYYWNAGMFAWTPGALLREARGSALDPLLERLDSDPEAGFAAVDPVSVDYAVLEGTDEAYVVPATFEWDDVGSWDALERLLEGDGRGNVAVGDALLRDAEGCVVATDGHVSAVGVEDLVIASYGDRTLVVPKANAQRVREVVARLRDRGLF